MQRIRTSQEPFPANRNQEVTFHLAQQVGHLGGELRLCSLWQLSVETSRQELLPALLVFILQHKQKLNGSDLDFNYTLN